MSYSNLANPGNHQLATFGQKGFNHLTGSQTANLGTHYNAITCLATATLTVVSVNGNDLTSISIPAGITIYGLFTTVTIAEGTVLAYIA